MAPCGLSRVQEPGLPEGEQSPGATRPRGQLCSSLSLARRVFDRPWIWLSTLGNQHRQSPPRPRRCSAERLARRCCAGSRRGEGPVFDGLTARGFSMTTPSASHARSVTMRNSVESRRLPLLWAIDELASRSRLKQVSHPGRSIRKARVGHFEPRTPACTLPGSGGFSGGVLRMWPTG